LFWVNTKHWPQNFSCFLFVHNLPKQNTGVVQGFFLRILWCSEGADHPETNLANSGYMPDMKVENNQGSFYILDYLLELIVEFWRFEIFFLFEIWRIWTIFPWKKNPLKITFFRLNFCKKWPTNKTLVWSIEL
jgi:hypothetical protein